MLTVYSASAGTGKTHTLTGEYLSLLFNGRDRHRHILAVTFTNKATAEMKNRIVEELFRLADHRPSDYLALLSSSGKKSESYIREQARAILINILHDYSAFNISTIDHFFQHTIRAFTREIGLQGNYQIELDESLMMEEAVENMLADLEKSENAALMKWLLRFTEDKIEEGGGWDIRRDIVKLGGQLFKETYKSFSHEILEKLRQKDFLSAYLDDLFRIIRQTHQAAKAFGEQGVLLMSRHGMKPSDFKRGANSAFVYFVKLADGLMDAPRDTFRALADNLDEYLARTASPALREAAARLFDGGMNDLVIRTVSFFDNLAEYYTAKEIARNFYSLGILADLTRHIAEWREENNKMLIADTTELLHRVIDGNEIPFIYEKTGTSIEHYMIDEFQDTSLMQWNNFRPLLRDSLGYGRGNLIVGDVKQSIYRFRNSDWTLLDSRVKQDFPQLITEKNLQVNWRSFRRIVEFNNMLFERIPAILQASYNAEIALSSLADEDKRRYDSRIVSAYANASQQVSPAFDGREGHVTVRFIENTDECKWQEESLNLLPGIIERLQDNGYELRDIAILTRTGREGAMVAETLLSCREAHPESDYRYDIISEDSLTVGSSPSVRWFTAMLRYLHQPDVAANRDLALAMHVVLRRKKQGSSGCMDLFSPYSPETVAAIRRLAARPLYELCEELFRLFEDDFPENELVFIQAFFDTVAEFSANETADAGPFLAWWNETGHRKKIVTPDSQDAIRIMTIHKAKGLGFKAVIIPFAEWKLDQRDVILWCRPDREPFDRISLLPLRYGNTVKNTFFAADYFHEKLHAYMDNLNTLYVAFTRAREELIVLAPKPGKEAATISRLLRDGLQADAPDGGDTDCCEWGAWWRTEKRKEASDTEELRVRQFHSVSPGERIQLRLQHRRSGLLGDEKRKYGLLMHDILSCVEGVDDVDRAVETKYASGEITRLEADVLLRRIDGLVRSERVEKWFDGSMQVMNEVEILFGKGRSHRPDRVMTDGGGRVVVVDYKFGEQKDPFHRRQVRTYLSLIQDMGYRQVEGYLWYVALDEIERCVF
jgi:ATP-dependent exoDNAse (exonuclease V) beta subunit